MKFSTFTTAILAIALFTATAAFGQELKPTKVQMIDLSEKASRIDASSEDGQRISRIAIQIKAGAEEIEVTPPANATTSASAKSAKGGRSAATVLPPVTATIKKASTSPGAIMMSDEPSLWEYKRAAVLLTTAEVPGPIDLVAQLTYGDGHTDGGIFHLYNGVGIGWGFSLLNLFPTNFTPGGLLTAEVFFIGPNYFSRVSAQTNIFGEEQSKNPEILSISEQSLGYTTLVTAKGHFQFCRPTVVLDWGIVPDANIITNDLGRIQINTAGMYLPQGKYRMTICQNGECDSFIGRHRY